MTLILPDRFREMSPERAEAMICKAHPGVFAERMRGFENSAVHWEWYDLAMTEYRLACVAPRDHAKTEVFTVNMTTWRSLYTPGLWTFVFCATKDLAEELKTRVKTAMEEVEPAMVRGARSDTKTDIVFKNYSRLSVAGAGSAVRSKRPDVIIGDDVLEEKKCRSSEQRRKTHSWWHGTVANMAHPAGLKRSLGGREKVEMPATRIFLIGTPFHEDDLISQMKANPIYRYRRYAAEYGPEDLVDGLAVDVA